MRLDGVIVGILGALGAGAAVLLWFALSDPSIFRVLLGLAPPRDEFFEDQEAAPVEATATVPLAILVFGLAFGAGFATAFLAMT